MGAGNTMVCYVMLCYVMLCYVMLCYVMLCYGHFSELGVGLHGKYAYIFILDAL